MPLSLVGGLDSSQLEVGNESRELVGWSWVSAYGMGARGALWLDLGCSLDICPCSSSRGAGQLGDGLSRIRSLFRAEIVDGYDLLLP